MDAGKHGEPDFEVQSHAQPAQSHARYTQKYDQYDQSSQQQTPSTLSQLDYPNYDSVDASGATPLGAPAADQLHPHRELDRPPIPYQAALANNLNFAANVHSTQRFPPSTDPDDFHRSYCGVPSADIPLVLSPPLKETMAAATPMIRAPSSLRSNSNGTTPRHPTVPSGHSGSRTSIRSASNPVDDRGRPTKGKGKDSSGPGAPCVKDLMRRFDQINGSNEIPNRSTTVRLLTTTTLARDQPSSRVNGQATGPGNGAATPYSRLRTSASHDASTPRSTRAASARGMQRNKFVAEDHESSTSQSFAIRLHNARPQNQRPANAQPPRSVSHAMSAASKDAASAQFLQRTALLFGEMRPEDTDSTRVALGSMGSRPRRTSESQTQAPARSHLRSFSDLDVEPPSPTDWYRDTPLPSNRSAHARAHSDTAGPLAQATKFWSRNISNSANRQQTPNTHPPSPGSLIPFSLKKISQSGSSGSPASTRSNSPAHSTKLWSGGGRSSRQATTRAKTPSTAASRATTPTTRAKTLSTPLSSTTRGLASSQNSDSADGRGRLDAYVAGPPPRLSPTLRSSRPRLSVATATTAAARMRAVERAPLSRTGPKGGSTPAVETASSRRKISVGPIDFAKRRETIKLAYSESIKETHAREASRAAAERRKRELEVVARRKAEAEAATLAATHAAASASGPADRGRPPEPRRRNVKTTTVPKADLQPRAVTKPDLRPLPPSLSNRPPSPPPPPIPTFAARESGSGEPAHLDSGTGLAGAGLDWKLDSPTAGVPERFPDLPSPPREQEPEHEQVPQSAVSSTTAATEFDGEVQIEPPIQKALTSHTDPEVLREDHVAPVPFPPFTNEGAFYVSSIDRHGMAEGSGSIKVSIGLSTQPRPTDPDSPTLVLEPGAYGLTATFPGSLQADEEQQPYPEEHVPEAELLPEAQGEPRQQPSAEPTLTSDVYEASGNTMPNSNRHEVDDTGMTDYSCQTPEAGPLSYEDQYQLSPLTFTAPTYKTTVTILGPEPEFRPLEWDRLRDSRRTSAEAIENDSEGRDHLEAQASKQPGDQDAPLRLEDIYLGTRLRDDVRALRDSAYTMSDSDVYDLGPGSGDYLKSPTGTSHSLAVQPRLEPANRLSQTSTWTDFSVESSDGRDSGPQSARFGSHEAFIRRQPSTGKITASPGDFGVQGLGHDETRGDVSPLDTCGSLDDLHKATNDKGYEASEASDHVSADLAAAFGEHQRGAATMSTQPLHRPSSPSLLIPRFPSSCPPPRSSCAAPPLPPLLAGIAAAGGDGLLASELDAAHVLESRPGSSRQGPDDPSLEMDRSKSTQSPERSSVETGAGPSIATTLNTGSRAMAAGRIPETERKRLRQRQLVIKELVDTECLFVRDMSVVEEIYKGTAEACPGLDAKTMKVIFRNSDDIIAFHTAFCSQLRDGVLSLYGPNSRRAPLLPERDMDTIDSTRSFRTEPDDERDRQTSIGPLFTRNIEGLKAVHETYLRASDQSTKRLLQIQEDRSVKLWLNECNEAAKDLTSAWNLDSLLIKPMQRLTKYPDLITHLLKYTPEDHPDREALVQARTLVMDAIDDINKTKKNFELVGQIVGRKRKDSDVRAGLVRAFGKRVDKLQSSTTAGNRPSEDDEYAKLNERFGDDYLRLQVVLRDVEYYTRTVAAYVHEFLQYLSSMELVMRLQPSRNHAHLESKWVQFNVSMRDIEKVALERHLSDVRKHVIEPFENVIRCYANPATAMRKRAKRRLDYEKFVQLKAGGKKVDKQLSDQVEQYEALNDALKKELPKLSDLTARVGNICLGKFVSIQASWYGMWTEKMKAPLPGGSSVPELLDIATAFNRDFRDVEEEAQALGILNPLVRGRTSQSTTDDTGSTFSKSRPSRPADLLTPRSRGVSITSNGENVIPSLPTPDFAKRLSGQFSMSPSALTFTSSPTGHYRDCYSGIQNPTQHAGPARAGGPVSSLALHDLHSSSRSTTSTRPGTSRSLDSTNYALPRQSSDSMPPPQHTSFPSLPPNPSNFPGPPTSSSSETRCFSGLFQSALPLPDGAEDSRRSSQASSRSRERQPRDGYNILWLAASLFEFNIETTKHEAGYVYLTYQAGEIFDVIAEKGELWLAKNQDDPRQLVGWIWSKHFARLADS